MNSCEEICCYATIGKLGCALQIHEPAQHFEMVLPSHSCQVGWDLRDFCQFDLSLLHRFTQFKYKILSERTGANTVVSEST